MRNAVHSGSVILALLVFCALAPASNAATGLPLPRFVSLGSEKINVRTGPGTRYPVIWQFIKENLPVEIIAEFGNWRKIRDFDSSEGWVHTRLLSGTRWGLVQGDSGILFSAPNQESPALLIAEPGVLARLYACRAAWCNVRISGRRGWIQRPHLWGVYPDEEFR